ncbi:M48 family peptidase [Flavobacterium rhamnosiphilum]|uniref:M48 family peptidase n=1 Tax=Flavobacterium rhamnosiphilum TaxID=2541724 RepID=A0A4R5FAM2_9FLAO|nr:SprT family zinc-dependent metalloprotease [Flavobacterium rhamnosiphilum]TDE45881.1 M48 family peptidase [Flavobacterium rhamnosiphilum]
MQEIQLGDITVEVTQKDIKNVHLSVYPPFGKVKIAAPNRMDIDTIRIYAISKLSWIRKQQVKIKAQKREAPREYLTKESHYFLGKRYLLKVIEHNGSPVVKLKHNTIELYIRPETETAKRKEILEEWYRTQLKVKIPELISKWETVMDVNVNGFGIKKMKTKWGTCNIEAQRIWLNLELAKKPITCLEYIIIHEMTHLLERNHNSRFVALMNSFLPNWKEVKEELNRLPVSHTEWGY